MIKFFINGYPDNTPHHQNGSTNADGIRVLAHHQNLAQISQNDLHGSQNGNWSRADNLERNSHGEVCWYPDQADPNEQGPVQRFQVLKTRQDSIAILGPML